MSGPGPSMHGGIATYDIFVGNLPLDSNETYLTRLYAKFGEIHSVLVMLSTKPGANDKIAFVRFLQEDSAQRAAEETNGMVTEGRNLNVKRSENKKKQGYPGGPGDRKRKMDRMGNQSDFGVNHGPGAGGGSQMNHTRVSTAEILREEYIIATHVETPLVFWAQVATPEHAQELDYLTETLRGVCPVATPISGQPIPTKIYASKYTEDDNWYRCKAIRKVSETQSEVLFIDYGNTEVKNHSDIVELVPNQASSKPHAQRYILFGLKETYTDPESMGFRQGVAKLQRLAMNKHLKAKVCNVKSAGTIHVIVEENDMDINQEVLSSGFAERLVQNFKAEPNVHTAHTSHLHHGPVQMSVGKWNSESSERPRMASHQQHSRGFQGHTAGQPQQHAGKPFNQLHSQDNNGYGKQQHSRGFQGYTAGQPQQHAGKPFNQLHSQDNNGYGPSHQPPVHRDGLGAGGGGDVRWSPADAHRLRDEVNQAKAEAQRLKQRLALVQEAANKEMSTVKVEWDKAVLELATCKGKLKNREEDYATLVKHMSQQDLSQRLKQLVESVSQVKQLRLQFPTEDKTEDNIEKAIGLASDTSKVPILELEVVAKVKNSLEVYKTTQGAVRATKDMSVIEDLKATRDQARITLHDAINVFLESMKQLPLSTRADQLEDMLTLLEKTYTPFLKFDVHGELLSLEDTLTMYHDWKAQKVSDFQEARTWTNTWHNSVSGSLRSIQEQLSLDTGTSNDNCSIATSLDQLLESFQKAVNVEISKTDLCVTSLIAEKSSDVSFIAMLLRSLTTALSQEQAAIQILERHVVEYTSLRESLAPWLTNKPSLDEISSVRKRTKALKSKLRHKVADLEDLEENEADTEEVCALRKELAAVRHELHAEFIKEDTMLADLADLNESHFPELSLECPDLGIDNEVEFGGMVKQGRALDQFHLEPMPDTTKKTIHKSYFCSKPIVLKEYIIDESLGIKKSDFLRRAVAYNSVINPHLSPFDGLFFTKTGRQVHVQLPFHEHSLTTYVQENKLSEENMYHILRGILMALQALHTAKLIHGSVNPSNVLVNSDDRAILAEFDFSKTLKQRVKQHVTSNGLSFLPPELANGQEGEVCWSSDMYNFGLLALWLHFPTYKFVMKHSGVPDFSPLQMERPLEQMLMSLLQEEPSSRRSAHSTWALSFFSNSPYSRPSSPNRDTLDRKADDTLQLRPKDDSRPSPAKSPNGGILKYTVPESPPNTENIVNVMSHDSSSSTPVLVASPQGTPVNTPVEGEATDETVPEDVNDRSSLVRNVMIEAARLVALTPEGERSDNTVLVDGDMADGQGDQDSDSKTEKDDVFDTVTSNGEPGSVCDEDGGKNCRY